MASQQDLLLAILAMDAYSQGYLPGMTINSSTWARGSIGAASYVTDDPDINTSFYAVEYKLSDGMTVISYRGTRFDGIIGPDLTAVLSGWSSSLGFSTASEAQEALTFYNQVVARVGGPDNVILTGHSLGGGLAGFVADLNGVQADVFDNIPFGAAVYAETDDSSYTLPLSSHYVTQFVTLGEVATGLRSAEFEVASPVIGPVGALYGLYLDNALNVNGTATPHGVRGGDRRN